MVCKCYSIVSFHNFATTFFVFLSPRHTFVSNGYFSPSSPPPLPSPLFSLTCDFCFIFPQIPFSPPRFPSLFLSPFPLSFLIFPHFTPLLRPSPPVHLSIFVPLAHLFPIRLIFPVRPCAYSVFHTLYWRQPLLLRQLLLLRQPLLSRHSFPETKQPPLGSTTTTPLVVYFATVCCTLSLFRYRACPSPVRLSNCVHALHLCRSCLFVSDLLQALFHQPHTPVKTIPPLPKKYVLRPRCRLSFFSQPFTVISGFRVLLPAFSLPILSIPRPFSICVNLPSGFFSL